MGGQGAFGLTGTKFSCGIGPYGACTVHIDGKATRSCITPIKAVSVGQKITTIKGLSSDNSHPLQKAWVEAQVPQCGYCQSGQIMQAAGLFNENPKPTKLGIVKHMSAISMPLWDLHEDCESCRNGRTGKLKSNRPVLG